MKQAVTETPTIEQCSELIQRICSSNELRRAARLKDFLQYVGQRALESDHVQISEYEIGAHVFGRPENYDTSSDNIVRVNASELRKRIAAYYAAEGADETILIDIPRGSYSPVFSLRSSTATKTQRHDHEDHAEPGQVIHVPAGSEHSVLRLRLLRYGTAVLVFFLVGICLYLFHQNQILKQRFYGWRSQPTMGSFWSNMLQSPHDTDVVLADTSVAIVEDILQQNIALNDYLDHEYTAQIQASDLSQPLKSELEDVASRNNGSVSDFRVAQKILDLDPNSGHVHLQYARDYRPRAVNDHNIVLIGSGRSNPWCQLFENQLNFVIEYDPSIKAMLVKNHHPLTNEAPVYAASLEPRHSADFSTISFIPNQNHSANVLIIAGTNSEATEAAGDFITNEESLANLKAQLHVQTLPYFEVLLKTTRLAGAPLTAQVVALRTTPGRPITTP